MGPFARSLEADMRLCDALRIKGGEVVAFVGSGGKSAAIRRLVVELSAHIPVLVTTAARIELDRVDLADTHLVLRSRDELRTALEPSWTFTSLLLTGPKHGIEPRWLGLDPALIEELIRIVQARGWVLLIEAEGTRGRSEKVPVQHEHALPSSCDLIVPVVGVDVIGEESASTKIQGADIWMRRLDLDKRDRIRNDHVVELITSSQGMLTNFALSSSVRVLLNKADSDRDLENGREIAQGLIKDKRIQSVLLASVMEENPVRESISRVGGVVLAAGGSTRLAGVKQLTTFRGKPLVAHAVETALAGDLDPVVVVVGREGKAIENAVAPYPVQMVENPEPERGQSSSVQLGLELILDQIEAVVFLLADMPLITSELVKALVREYQRTLSPIIAPISEGRRGNPVLFDRNTFDALQDLKGDEGGRAIFSHSSVAEIEWDDSVLFDIDSEEDLRKMREME